MNRILKTLICVLCFCHLSVGAQTLHALLFINEKESGREFDRSEDMRNMNTFLRNVSTTIGYSYNPQKFSDKKFTSSDIKQSISNLDVESGDIVVFYYSGHGYNDESDIWPSLSLNDNNYRQIDILKLLKEVSSEAKLVLCIADCCNKQYRGSYDITSSYDSFDSQSNNPIKKLFTGFNGKKTIIMSASKQGQYSYSDTRYGAFFGISLRKSITELNSERLATWDQVMQKASSYTSRYTDGKQIPQYNVTQSGDPFE